MSGRYLRVQDGEIPVTKELSELKLPGRNHMKCMLNNYGSTAIKQAGEIITSPKNLPPSLMKSVTTSPACFFIRTIIIVAALIVIFTACQLPYTHPTKNSQDFNHDIRECEKIAKHRVAEAGYPGNPFFIEREEKKCMHLNFGWIQEKEN